MTDKIIEKEETRPCGCHLVTYADKTGTVSPCPPCGLMDAARALSQAASAIGAVATRLRMDMQQSELNEVARQVAGRKLEIVR